VAQREGLRSVKYNIQISRLPDPSRFRRDLAVLNLCVMPDAGTRSAPRVMAALAGVIHDR
jgi:hypothetical protein